MLGTALNRSSRVWFILIHGIFDEIYYPRVDQDCTCDIGMIVTDGKDFFSEEKRQTIQQVDPLALKILSGEFHEDETIHVERGKERLKFTALASDQLAAA